MPTIDHNGKQITVGEKVATVYRRVSSDRGFAALVRDDPNKALQTYKLTSTELAELKKLLPR